MYLLCGQEWLLPSDYDQNRAEAEHLIRESGTMTSQFLMRLSLKLQRGGIALFFSLFFSKFLAGFVSP
jgi:hypothetical protein